MKKKLFVSTALLLLVGAGCSLDTNTSTDVTVNDTDRGWRDGAIREESETTEKTSTVDTPNMTMLETGEYVVTSGEASYIAQKEFFSKPTAEVTGTTPDVTGTIDVNSELKTVSVEATIQNTFTTDSDTRDGDVVKLLAGPIAIKGEGLPFENFEKGAVTLTLTIAGMSQDIPFSVTVSGQGSEARATGSASFLLSDFNLEAPSLLNVYTVSDVLAVTFDISAKK
ncbi:MAG: hypothetical protein UV82_C0003G0005 [Candidatus Magasanikbacteria bacterium GW2011_GWD2_43_18]|uniref:Lipid/polyisoprenoid-binding YceI-like domain-containing protein n=1 Tax=Candidatus Magasanikbacteria bacterium GW2011_GWE2_42_7 TaxID=1619052 RepID=A0A0G1EC59_9BACT|nr:MAG: hypothetical protein UV18_C0012G0011 [Candidatus Magasanikbacteria bacterium GW2011_GWC2_42_27]KKS72178.1 MAG: hypothetical protein UV42_C0012G0005 [Candidatus Magasanikbacteria bacterium GW2011_GWE2_42_7]KKT04906.1 MAG: hypothetical protein UV82_C0003G0005 [Candidatus Magasanikbacteria bacterium GW2011_GWD2_43_18]KKT25406.1 MAG: hypothetical protein UW10_C0008G0018 [Candidatus Magasanikbacteria bacterium GW2011_GWA2_43_9]HBB37816.1 hypothetical protein [Candidatus Magasanikbacteria bac